MTTRFPFLPLLLFVLCFPPGSLGARQVEREVRIPLAPQIGVIELSPELRDRLGLFPGDGTFLAARLLRSEDGSTILEIERLAGGELQRERRRLAPAELDALRADLAGRFAASDAAPILDREGRGGLVLSQTLLGLGFYGWALPYAFDIDSAQGAVATYLLTAGAAFYLPYRLTRNRSVTEAHRDLSFYGGTRGILFGALAADAFADPDGSDVGRIRVGAGMAGSLGGSLLGFLAADRGRPDPGRAALWAAMGDFGFLAGAALGYAAGPYASQEIYSVEGDYFESRTRNRSLGHAFTLAGGAGGLVAGRWLGARERYTEGNVGALRSAGILGAQVGLALTRGVGTEEERALAAGALAGGVAGIVLGNRLLREKRFSGGEGLLVNAAHIAGGAIALGLTYLAVEEIDEHPLLYMTTSAAGSALGAGLVFRALGEGSGIRPTLSLGR